MSALAVLNEIAQILFQAVELGVKYGPQIMADLKRIWDLATSGTELTPEQAQDARTAMDAAYEDYKLQRAATAASDAVAAEAEVVAEAPHVEETAPIENT